MGSSYSRGSTFERVLTEQNWVRQFLVVLVVFVAWVVWTVWSGADWVYQALFLFLASAAVTMVTRSAWILNCIIILLVGDVTGYLTELINIPGLIGFAGVAGKAKIPELLSVFAVCHMVVYFFLRPQEFRQPLVGNFVWFIGMGMIGTAIGLRQYIGTNALRDSLGYYFSAFYIIGLVLLPTAAAAKGTFRVFYYTALLVLLYCYVYSAVTGTTKAFYPATLGMFFSACAYFLVTKLFSSPRESRKWLTFLMVPLFCGAMFIGRSRGGVLAFTIGMVPLFFALRGRHKLGMLFGLLVPCIVLMAVLFKVEQRRSLYGLLDDPETATRDIRAFTEIGRKESDPTGNYRLYMWKMAWSGFLESPLVGKGYGWRLPIRTGTQVLEEELPAATIHNSFMHALACGGLLGFIPLAAIVFRFFLLCWREYRKRPRPEHRLWPACAASIGLNFFLMALTNVGFEQVASGLIGWLLLAIAVRMATTPSEELAALVPRRLGLGVPPPPPRASAAMRR